MGLEIFERGVLPRWARVRQRLHSAPIEDVAAAVAEQFRQPAVRDVLRPGARVALTAGSRGIDRIGEVLAATVAELRRLDADPFVVPAMGSHGGATADGQIGVLAEYGITEQTVGCPIRSSMETELLGHVGDVPVWTDRTALREADLIIPINRVKPHTDFHGTIESGLLKMLAIGLGKQHGADTFHGRGFHEFHELIPAVGTFVIAHLPIPFGLALVEDGHARLSLIEAIPAAQIDRRERELLAIAREWLPRLPGEQIDVLIIDQLGKDISGIGADTNVVNRYYDGPLPFKPSIQRIIVRDLTRDTEGNASGIGLADVALRCAIDKFDPIKTYMNCVTAKTPEGARVPLTVENDRQALFVALACCLQITPDRSRIVRIRDTKHVADLWVSEPLLESIRDHERIDVLSDPAPIAFDDDGMLIDDAAA